MSPHLRTSATRNYHLAVWPLSPCGSMVRASHQSILINIMGLIRSRSSENLWYITGEECIVEIFSSYMIYYWLSSPSDLYAKSRMLMGCLAVRQVFPTDQHDSGTSYKLFTTTNCQRRSSVFSTILLSRKLDAQIQKTRIGEYKELNLSRERPK